MKEPLTMPTRFLLVAALVVASFAGGMATTTLSFDASWWNDLNHDDRVQTTMGLVQGYSEGYLSGYAKGMGDVTGLLPLAQRLKLYDNAKYMSFINGGQVHFSKTFGTYVDEITDFYTNYPTLGDLPVGRFFDCMTDDATATCDALARRTLKARSGGK